MKPSENDDDTDRRPTRLTGGAGGPNLRTDPKPRFDRPAS